MLAFRYGRVAGAREFGWLMGIGTIWSVTSVFELVASDVSSKVFWSILSYIGSQMTPPLYFVFAVRFCGWGTEFLRRRTALLFVVPMISLCMAATNHLHGLLWTSVDIVPVSRFLVGVYARGPWFWIEVAYSDILLLGAMTLFVAGAIRFPHIYSIHSRLLVFAGLLPIAGHIVYAFFAPSANHLDWTPAIFSLSGVILSFGVLRFRLFDLVPVARDSVVENLPDCVVVLDSYGRIADFNPAASRLFGLVRSDMGRRCDDFFASVPEIVSLCDSGGNAIVCPGGRLVMEVCSAPLRNGSGTFIGHLLTARDVTERTELEDRLLFLGTHDSLTGLSNRSRFDAECASAGKDGPFPVAVFAFDVDGLKQINDTLGHPAGDELLKRTASVLAQSFSGATVARVGGDEFAALLPGTGDDGAKSAMIRLEALVQDANAISGVLPIALSAGFAIIREGESPDAGYRMADAAMYAAKAQRKRRALS